MQHRQLNPRRAQTRAPRRKSCKSRPFLHLRCHRTSSRPVSSTLSHFRYAHTASKLHQSDHHKVSHKMHLPPPQGQPSILAHEFMGVHHHSPPDTAELSAALHQSNAQLSELTNHPEHNPAIIESTANSSSFDWSGFELGSESDYNNLVLSSSMEQSFPHPKTPSTHPTKNRRLMGLRPSPIDLSRIPCRNVVPPPEYDAPVPHLARALRGVVQQDGPVSLGPMDSHLPYIDPKYVPPGIPQPEDIKWEAIPPFVTSSRDTSLQHLAEKYDARLMGSTSSIGPLLAQLHFALTDHAPINIAQLSHWFQHAATNHTRASVKPAVSLLRKRSSHLWGIDNAPSGDPKQNQILIDLGKSLERQLTFEPQDFFDSFVRGDPTQYLAQSSSSSSPSSQSSSTAEQSPLAQLAAMSKKHSKKPTTARPPSVSASIQEQLYSSNALTPQFDEPPSSADLQAAEAHAFLHAGNLVLRSQLDCENALVPSDKKVFDLKTRATLPIRLDVLNHKDYLDYEITTHYGLYNSFEREFYDMARSAFLKYAFQCRIGNMGGVFVAYHNTRKLFGFEYISVPTMDRIVYGNSEKAEFVFRNALALSERLSEQIIHDLAYDDHGDDKQADSTTHQFSPDTIRVTCRAKDKGKLLVVAERFPRVNLNDHQALDAALSCPYRGHIYADWLTEEQARLALERRGVQVAPDEQRAHLISRLESMLCTPAVLYQPPSTTFLQNLAQNEDNFRVYELHLKYFDEKTRAAVSWNQLEYLSPDLRVYHVIKPITLINSDINGNLQEQQQQSQSSSNQSSQQQQQQQRSQRSKRNHHQDENPNLDMFRYPPMDSRPLFKVSSSVEEVASTTQSLLNPSSSRREAAQHPNNLPSDSSSTSFTEPSPSPVSSSPSPNERPSTTTAPRSTSSKMTTFDFARMYHNLLSEHVLVDNELTTERSIDYHVELPREKEEDILRQFYQALTTRVNEFGEEYQVEIDDISQEEQASSRVELQKALLHAKQEYANEIVQEVDMNGVSVPLKRVDALRLVERGTNMKGLLEHVDGYHKVTAMASGSERSKLEQVLKKTGFETKPRFALPETAPNKAAVAPSKTPPTTPPNTSPPASNQSDTTTAPPQPTTSSDTTSPPPSPGVPPPILVRGPRRQVAVHRRTL